MPDYTKFMNSPQYLKNMRKIQNMNPEDKAVTSTLISQLQGLYAGQDMQAMLQSMKIGAQVQQQERAIESGKARMGLAEQSYGLQKEGAERRYGLEKDTQKFIKAQNKAATNLGWANVGLSALSGVADYKRKQRETKMYEDIAWKYKHM